jgi:3-oxoacyl-(acyl-carrier-protein) synthase
MREWYEAAGRLRNGFVPGEGLAAVVMEAGARYQDRGARAYRAGKAVGGADASQLIGEFDGSGILRFILALS